MSPQPRRLRAPFRLGLTLVEILAVVVILGVLAATLTYGIGSRIGKARHEIARTQISQIVTALEMFRLEKRRLPTAAEGLNALTTPVDAPYALEAGKLLDPWGKPYLYLVPGPNGNPFEVLTYGSDGQQGGEGDKADLTSTNLSGQTAAR